MSQVRVEIIVVGNELLNGTTLDTNSFWLSKRLSKIGFKVERKITVRDELGVISSAFRQAMSRKVDWIFSVGGLGPTFDDMTSEALSLALGQKLEVNSDAVRMLKESYKRRVLSKKPIRRLSRARLKMATIPHGATPLSNSVGSAPGILAKKGRTSVVLLPGVPSEMRAIFSTEVVPLLEKGSVFTAQRWIKSVGIAESQLSPVVSKLYGRFKSVLYVKSHPAGYEKDLPKINIQIILTVPRERKKEGLEVLEKAANSLIQSARKLGADVSVR